MEPFGWVVMLVSVTTVISTLSYCLYRVLSMPPVSEDESE